MSFLFFFFFFQAEDGIRDFHVTGVQTCALPISGPDARCAPRRWWSAVGRRSGETGPAPRPASALRSAAHRWPARFAVAAVAACSTTAPGVVGSAGHHHPPSPRESPSPPRREQQPSETLSLCIQTPSPDP